MKTRKVLFVLCTMLLMGLYSGVIYANDSSEGYNIETVSVTRNNKEIEILASQDGYLQITQIGQNSQNVKIATSTFDERVLISGRSSKGTNLLINVYQDDKCQDSYSTTVGSTGTFSHTLDLLEGYNKIIIYYSNSDSKAQVDDYIVISITRESAASMEKLTTWIVPSL